MTITEFLLARIAEDEALARAVAEDAGKSFARSPADYGGVDPTTATGCWSADGNAGDPVFAMGVARVLAECDAKRRIVELHQGWPVLVTSPPGFSTDESLPGVTMRMSQQIQWQTQSEYRERFGDEPPTAPILAILALPYADHPDYRDEWRP